MKKPNISPMIVVTLAFAVILAGIYGYRNYFAPEIRVEYPADNSVPVIQQPDSPARIDINTATVEEMSTLPGIGEKLAQRIAAYRLVHGSFTSLEELLNIEGIGSGKLKAILDYITIGGIQYHENSGR